MMKKAIVGFLTLMLVLCCVLAQPVTAYAEENCMHLFCMVTLKKEATCTQDGLKQVTCAQCGDSWTEVIPMAEHFYDEGEIIVEPSCGQDGEYICTCQNCGHVRGELIAGLEHEYGTGVVTKEATCEENGEAVYTCQRCGDSYTEIIYARGWHWMSDGEVTKEPTCTEEGIYTSACSDCGWTTEEVIPANGHTFDQAPDPVTGYSTCSVCGHSEFVHDHQWGTWTVTKIATYTEPGEHTYSCTLCGEVRVTSLGCLEATPEEVYMEILRLVNIEREKAGVAPLAYRYEAQIAVDARAQDLIVLFDHYRPNGTKCYSALDDYGIKRTRTMGENIAWGYRSPQEVMEGWMDSPGHRANILDPDYTHIAIGGVGYRWVQMFFG